MKCNFKRTIFTSSVAGILLMPTLLLAETTDIMPTSVKMNIVDRQVAPVSVKILSHDTLPCQTCSLNEEDDGEEEDGINYDE